MDSYLALNKANWDDRAPAHAASPDYALDRFLADPGFLSAVIRFDLPRLGDVAGARGVHLQCHIGTDTVSLARLGASMTGVDFSPASLAQARALAQRTGADARFVESDVHAAPAVLGEGGFDLVYTGIGALCWLPDIARWAQVAAALLAPGGRLFIRDAHPMLGTVAGPSPDGPLAVEHSYFERPEPDICESETTYVQTGAVLAHTTTHQWNHGLGELVAAVLDAGMTVTGLAEHDSAPWEALPGHMARDDAGEWRLADRPWRLPCTFTLQATRN